MFSTEKLWERRRVSAVWLKAIFQQLFVDGEVKIKRPLSAFDEEPPKKNHHFPEGITTSSGVCWSDFHSRTSRVWGPGSMVQDVKLDFKDQRVKGPGSRI